jgi:hypothetical protein
MSVHATTALRACYLYVLGDSMLMIINQAMNESSYQDENIEAYYREVHKMEGKFNGIKLHHIVQCDKGEGES